MATPIPTNAVPFTLDEALSATGGTLAQRGASRALVGVHVDSRAVTPGSIFVALRGDRHDAHAFLPAVIEAGAGAVIVDHEIGPQPSSTSVIVVADTLRALGDLAAAHRSRFVVPVVAITGSVGKTTTRELTTAALSTLGLEVHATRGNLNNRIGVPMTLFGIDAKHEVVVLELGMSEPGEIARLTEIAKPNVGVVTAVAEVHTEGVGSLAGVAAEKGALLLGLPPDGYAIWTADDAVIARYAERSPARVGFTFGSSAQATVRLADHRVGIGGTHVAYAARGVATSLEGDLPRYGKAPSLCAAAALAVVLALRGPDALELALRGIEGAAPGAGRGKPFFSTAGWALIDDTYNASPRSTELALHGVADIARETNGRALVVLGDMLELGVDSERLHERVGAAAIAAGVDLLVCVGPEMRAAARGALEAAISGASGIRIERVDDVGEAVRIVRDVVEANDVILVKGSRGMRMERVVEALTEAAS